MNKEIIYQIFPDRFFNGNPDNDSRVTKQWGDIIDRDCVMGGDLTGITKKLDYISDLGASTIYLNPIFKASSNHKYDTNDYYEIDDSFGNLNDFIELIDECHERNIKIIIDGVFNHTGIEFFAFQDILKNNQKSKYKDWYDIYSYPVVVSYPPNYRACGGAEFIPKLNTSNPKVQDYIIEVIKYWESKGIDGIRLDVPFEIDEELLSKIRHSTNLYIVGEIWGYGSHYVPQYFDGVTNYLFRDLLIKSVINQCINGLMFIDEWKTIENLYGENIFNNVNLMGSHDTERIFTLCNGNIKKVNLCFGLIFLLPGIPLVYYGDEIGLEGENDPYCRGTMVWNKSKWKKDIYKNIQDLIYLRKSRKALQSGNIHFYYANDRVIGFIRKYKEETIKVLVNFGFQDELIDGVQIEALSYKILE